MFVSIGIPYAVYGTVLSMETVGQRIKKRRMELGISQAALARAIGIKPPSLADIESGKTKRAAGQTLIDLARELRTDPEYFLSGVSKPSPVAADPSVYQLSASEEKLILHFRQLSPGQQAELLRHVGSVIDGSLLLAKKTLKGTLKHVPDARIEETFGMPGRKVRPQ